MPRATFSLVGERVFSLPKDGPDSQRHRLLSHYNLGSMKFRVRLSLDHAYVSQSSFVVEVWMWTTGWTEVATVLGIEAQGQGKDELLRLEALLLERARWVMEG